MQQKIKYSGGTQMQIDNKLLQKFYSFHTEVTTIFNSVDLNVLIMIVRNDNKTGDISNGN